MVDYPCESRRRKGVLTGVAFTQRGVALGELIVEENQKEGLTFCDRDEQRMHRVFIFQSVRSRSSFPERIEKGNDVCFFRATKVLNKHRLLAVKYYTPYLFTIALNNSSVRVFARALPFQRGG